MKHFFAGSVALVFTLILGACSEESSTPDEFELLSSSSEIYDTSLDISSSSVMDTVESTADQPITEEELEEDGTTSVDALTISVSGVAEYGPFVASSPIYVYSVDATTMGETLSLTTLTTNVLGAYSVAGAISSAIASFDVSGTFYDFPLDKGVNISSLKAVSDMRTRTKVNINVFTHLEYFRVYYLVSQQGLSFTAAKERAESEILEAFGFDADSTLFEEISLYDMTDAAGNLLAVTAALGADEQQVETLLNALASDLMSDGKLDDDSYKALLGDAAYDMDVNSDISYLSGYNSDADVFTYSGQKRNLWATMYNLGSCTSSNLNEVKQNQNSYSTYASRSYACKSGGWSLASEEYVLSSSISETYGTCDSTTQGTFITYTDGNIYVCKSNLWTLATDDEIEGYSLVASAGECNSSTEGNIAYNGSSYFKCKSNIWTKLSVTPIDYSKGRAMNQKLGRGINFGNSWDAPGSDDSGWSNPIYDADFATVKAAGFNSVRIPVRWETGVSTKLAGVKEDVQLAINAGLVVIINYHNYETMLEAAQSYPSGNYPSEKENFLSVWKQVAETFESFGDDEVVFEIFNEPREMTQEAVDDIMNSAYEVIRAASPGKTIMFEGNGYSKFAQIPKLSLPADGNIIVSGHYYEPYTFTHQGHGYDCNASASSGISSIAGHFESYVEAIEEAFPDINGGYIPVSLGEFGVANQGSCTAISESDRAAWTDAVIEQAEKYGMSWHYWAYVGVGGFEAAPNRTWSTQMLNVFQKYMD